MKNSMLFPLIMNKYILGYGISIIVGLPITLLWSTFLYWLLNKQRPNLAPKTEPEPERIYWIPVLIGIMERAIITTLIAFSVSGAAGFLGAWIAVKSAGGWATWSKGTTYGRAVLFVGLLGSAMSVLFGLAGGIIIAQSFK